MPKKKKKGGKKKKGKGGKKKGGKKKKGKKKKGKKAPKVDVNEFDSTPYINVSTGELPLPLDVAARIAIRFRTSLDLVYTKILLDPEMFEQFFQITDLTERMENLVGDEQEEAEGVATTESKDMEINKNEKLPFMTKTAMKKNLINEKYGSNASAGNTFDRKMDYYSNISSNVFALTALKNTNTSIYGASSNNFNLKDKYEGKSQQSLRRDVFDFPVHANNDSTSEDDFSDVYSDDSSENSSDDSLNDDDVIDVLTNSPRGKNKSKLIKSSEMYIKACRSTSSQIVTRVLQALEEDVESLDVNHGCLRSKGAILLFNVLENSTNEITTLSVRNNHIDGLAATAIANYVSKAPDLFDLDIGSNNIGGYKRQYVEALPALSKGLASGVSLEKLCLANNNFNDSFFIDFFQALCSDRNKTLKDLDISHNKMSWLSAQEMAKYLGTVNSLTSLNVAWNNLRIRGGKAIFEVLANNNMVTPDLTTLNVDWNGLDSEVAAIMSRWLLDSQSMQHITYSNNNIDAKGAIEIAKILEDNMSLEYMDASFNPLGTEGTKALIESLDTNGSLKVLRCIRTCIGRGIGDNVEKKEIEKVLKLRGEVILKRKIFTDIILDFPVADKGVFFSLTGEEKDTVDETEDETKDDSDAYYKSVWQIRCRDTDAESFWDTDVVQRRAFDSDWELSQISNLIYDIDELEPMQEILSRYFGTIRDLFRYYAATLGSGGNLLLFRKSAWLKFCQEMRFIDEDQLTTKDLSKLFGRCGGVPNEEGSSRQSDEGPTEEIQGLMRYEFLELIVRTSLQKYHTKSKTRKAEFDLLSPSEAIRRFMDKDILPYAFTTDHVGQFPGPSFFRGSDNFRDARLYFEEVNTTFCNYAEDLTTIFNFYARGDGSFTFATSYEMSLREWTHFCNESEICNDSFSRHDIALPFAYSIMCVVDETKSRNGDRVQDRRSLRSQIAFTDFLEALGRTAEMTESKTISDAKRPLSKKLDILIKHIISKNEAALKDEESGIADHFAEEKELELEKEREELVQLSKVFVPPDKGKVESEKKVEIKSSKDAEKARLQQLLGLIGKICARKIRADNVDQRIQTFPEFLHDFFMLEYGAGSLKKQLKSFLAEIAEFQSYDILVEWFGGVIGAKSEYDDDVLPLKGLRKTMKSYKKSLGATFLAVIESFLPLEHLEKRLRNSETLCHISNIKGATKNILKNKKDQDDCMKNFKIYLKNQGAGGAAKKVPFADTLNLLLLSWENRSKDNSGGGNSKRKKK